MSTATRRRRERDRQVVVASALRLRVEDSRRAVLASALREQVHAPLVAAALRERVHAPLVASLRQRVYGLTAASYDEMLHPRGHDGKWIEKLGLVKLLGFGDERVDGHRGQVTDIVPNKKTGKADIKVEVFNDDGSRSGTEITLKPENIEQAPEKARLGDEKTGYQKLQDKIAGKGGDDEKPSGPDVDERTGYQKKQDEIKAREPAAMRAEPGSSDESASRSIVWRTGSQVEAGDYVLRPSRGGKPGELTLVTDVKDTGDTRHLMLSDGGEVMTTPTSQLQVAVRNSKLDAEGGRGSRGPEEIEVEGFESQEEFDQAMADWEKSQAGVKNPFELEMENGPDMTDEELEAKWGTPRDFSHPGEPGYGEELPGFSEPESPYAPIDLRPPWDVEEAKRNIEAHRKSGTGPKLASRLAVGDEFQYRGQTYTVANIDNSGEPDGITVTTPSGETITLDADDELEVKKKR